MKRTLLLGFINEQKSIIEYIMDNTDWKPAYWIGDEEDGKEHTWRKLNILGYTNYDTYGGKNACLYKQVISDSIIDYLSVSEKKKLLSYKSNYDILSSFSICFDIASSIMTDNSIEQILCSEPPHTIFDIVLYRVAKATGVEVVMFYQSLLPNRFFYFYSLEDFGLFNEVSEVCKREAYTIKKEYKKELPYMKGHTFPKKALTSIPVKVARIILKSKYRRIFDPLAWRYLILNISNTVIRPEKHYYRIKKIQQKTPEIEVNYVYFPLHLQPELTTAPLGGIYCDQLLAIEHLSTHLPNDWYIYIKENPKQGTHWRDKSFFNRIKCIKNAIMVPPETSTYKLIEGAKFVATITGTSGWEAITGGKNVLIFGNAWYKTLPGVFSYDKNFNLNEIINYKINHKELEESISKLHTKMPYGAIDPSYSAVIENFDPKENTKLVGDFLIKILQINE